MRTLLLFVPLGSILALLPVVACGSDDGGSGPTSSSTSSASSSTGGSTSSGGSSTSSSGSSGDSGIPANPNAGKLVTSFGKNGVAVTTLDTSTTSLLCIVETATGSVFVGGQGNNGLFTGYGWHFFDKDGKLGIVPSAAKRLGGGASGSVYGCSVGARARSTSRASPTARRAARSRRSSRS